MAWGPKQAAARRERRNKPENRATLNERQREINATEARKAYMRAYNIANRERIAEQRRARADERNRQRRERYASDPEHRAKLCAAVREANRANPVRKRNGRLRADFGIGVEDYERLYAAQGGCCAICGRTHSDRRGHRLAVDHCHATGRVRGLLCSSCNQGLGKFADDPERLRRAADYLGEP